MGYEKFHYEIESKISRLQVIAVPTVLISHSLLSVFSLDFERRFYHAIMRAKNK